MITKKYVVQHVKTTKPSLPFDIWQESSFNKVINEEKEFFHTNDIFFFKTICSNTLFLKVGQILA